MERQKNIQRNWPTEMRWFFGTVLFLNYLKVKCFRVCSVMQCYIRKRPMLSSKNSVWITTNFRCTFSIIIFLAIKSDWIFCMSRKSWKSLKRLRRPHLHARSKNEKIYGFFFFFLRSKIYRVLNWYFIKHLVLL